MIIDTLKFTGLLHLNVGNIQPHLVDIIEQKERELLNAWFGYPLMQDLTSPAPSFDAQELIDGFEYIDGSGDLQYIDGLGDILLYFLYFYIMRDKQTYDSSIGQQLALAENSNTANPTHKLAENYNKGVKKLNTMLRYVSSKNVTYPDARLCGALTTINNFGI